MLNQLYEDQKRNAEKSFVKQARERQALKQQALQQQALEQQALKQQARREQALINTAVKSQQQKNTANYEYYFFKVETNPSPTQRDKHLFDLVNWAEEPKGHRQARSYSEMQSNVYGCSEQNREGRDIRWIPEDEAKVQNGIYRFADTTRYVDDESTFREVPTQTYLGYVAIDVSQLEPGQKAEYEALDMLDHWLEEKAPNPQYQSHAQAVSSTNVVTERMP